ncbi:MAG: hybrid sensor histidine kinase/response regulator [Alphaproteobacteria bacterium MedPE-SWcel]|nr:MAG: hybrid sensor histidine kinase/response regulator [Alphaproteobacteria bacterium MedPE-SWcel]
MELLAELQHERLQRQELQRQLERKTQSLRQTNASLVSLARQVDRMVRERTEDLDRGRSAAEAENEAKTQFLATMSHEIRTPLNGVLGMASALADTPLGLEQARILDVLRDSGRLLLNIVDDILDLTKIAEGKLTLEQLPTDVVSLTDAVCRQFEPRIRAKGLGFTKLCMNELAKGGVWVHIDPTRFQQVLSNLLSNAIKFTENGAIALTANLKAEKDGLLLLTLSVRDTGVGLSPRQVERLFQPYIQADASVHRNHGGTGLGLAIARQICQRMGGDLTCSSLEGDGSEFRASFRVSPAPAPEQDQAADPAESECAILSSRRWRVLVAEDNRTNRMVLRHMLKEYDLDMIWVQNGKKAVEAWSTQKPDLVLMDVNMPVLDGVSATEQIREREEAEARAPVPIIAVSANALVHQVKAYLEQGMTDHVAKPIRKQRLLQIMAQALSEAQGHDSAPEIGPHP